MIPTELSQRLAALDWSATSLQHQLAVAAAVETLAPRPAPTSLPIHGNVVALLPRRPTMRHVTLLHLSGALFATAGFLPGDAGAPWAWIQETIAAECGVAEDAVGCLEAGEDGGGDFVTVDGLPVYRVQIGCAPSI